MLGLDYYDHTEDTHEFADSILPLAVAVTDFVSSYFGRTPGGQLHIWPSQSLEGFRSVPTNREQHGAERHAVDRGPARRPAPPNP